MTWTNLDRATAEGRPVAFEYRPDCGAEGPRIVSPWERQGSRLVGFDHGRLALRRYRLDRVRALRHAPPTVDYRPPNR